MRLNNRDIERAHESHYEQNNVKDMQDILFGIKSCLVNGNILDMFVYLRRRLYLSKDILTATTLVIRSMTKSSCIAFNNGYLEKGQLINESIDQQIVELETLSAAQPSFQVLSTKLDNMIEVLASNQIERNSNQIGGDSFYPWVAVLRKWYISFRRYVDSYCLTARG